MPGRTASRQRDTAPPCGGGLAKAAGLPQCTQFRSMDRLFPLVGLLALLLALVAAAGTAEPAQAEGNLPKQDAQGVFEQQVVFPEYPTDEQDAYLCSAIALPDKPLKLVGIESTSDQRIVHHMLLFGAPPKCCGVPAAAAPADEGGLHLADGPCIRPALIQQDPLAHVTACRVRPTGPGRSCVELQDAQRLRRRQRGGALRLGQERGAHPPARRRRLQRGQGHQHPHRRAAGDGLACATVSRYP